MTAQELARLVALTRAAQRRYFATPVSAYAAKVEALGKAKKLEKHLDEAVAGVLNDQPKLFS